MMKVLWFTNTPCGATEYLTSNKVTGGGWLYSLSKAMVKQPNLELHIAFYWHQEIDAFCYEGIIYHPVLRDGLDSKLGRYIFRLKQQFGYSSEQQEIKRLERVISDITPDLIHFHGSEENFGLVAQHIQNIKTVLSIQGLLSPCYYKLFTGYSKADLIKQDSFIRRLLFDGIEGSSRAFRINALREQIIFKYIPNIIGRTDWDYDCSLALNPNRRYYVCNEILRQQFRIKKRQNLKYEDKIILATTISSGIYKGLEMVYQTAHLLCSQGINFEWNVIGVSSKDDITRVTNKITNIDPDVVHIKLLGRKNADEMIEILNMTHAFIQTSHIENSPNSLCEAMLLGMPIIASFAGGTSSMLEDGKEGILVQDGDPYRLAGAIIHMFQNYEKAILMGKAAHERAAERHDPNNVIESLLLIYYSICKQ